MDEVYMEVEQVRGGGGDLQTLAPKAKLASDRVEAPAQTAASSNAGFITGGAGVQWHGRFDTVTAGVERRVDWQGAQVTTSADELESCDMEVRGKFRALERRIPVRREP
ncbi:hypothetical protein [Glycomyces niveus]|uniref:Uncharacterized protein n=1 Tax=Glycomyces niveus TaxID=2820287 RepID=A0ABS3U327_9ACTN|nr:hypothetical protein [Glycomyces sp. NEAU-S30]MBO3733180.1 hypothetical protein [Glycomyces sp. NEAU-S30]